MSYTIPPDTRAVDTGDPPVDVNNLADMVGLITNILAGMAGFPGNADPASNAANVTNMETLKTIKATLAGLAPSGDTSGATDQANISGLIALAAGQTVQLQAGTFYTNAPLQVAAAGTNICGALPVGMSVNGVASDTNITRIKGASGWAAGAVTDPGVIWVDGVDNCCIQNLVVDGSAMGVSANGISLYGGCGSTTMLNMGVYSATNNGVSYISVSGSYPDGSEMINCVIYEGTNNGITGSLIDCTLDNVHVQQVGGDCFYIQGSNDRLTGCQADQSTNGFVFDEFLSQGGCNLLVNCGTAGNNEYGLYAANGSSGSNSARIPVVACNCTFNGDGANSGAGGGGYSAVACQGVGTMVLLNCNIFVNTNNVSAGCPEYALSTSKPGSSGPVMIQALGGIWNCISSSLYNDAGSTTQLSLSVYTYTGGMYAGTGSTPLTQFVINPVQAYVNEWTAADMGYAAMPFDPTFQVGASSTKVVCATSAFGELLLFGFQVHETTTITGKVDMYMNAAGGTLTTGENWLCLYSQATGDLVAQSADMTSTWGTGTNTWITGTSLTLQGGQSFTLAPGQYWLGIIINGTTAPSFSYSPGTQAQSSAHVFNGELGVTKARLGTYGSAGAYTTTPPATITKSSISLVGTIQIWFGIY